MDGYEGFCGLRSPVTPIGRLCNYGRSARREAQEVIYRCGNEYFLGQYRPELRRASRPRKPIYTTPQRGLYATHLRCIRSQRFMSFGPEPAKSCSPQSVWQGYMDLIGRVPVGMHGMKERQAGHSSPNRRTDLRVISWQAALQAVAADRLTASSASRYCTPARGRRRSTEAL